MEIVLSIIEGVKGMTGYGLIALGMLCATASFFAWLRVTHSVAWLQASPEQIQARAIFGRKPLSVAPPIPVAQALPAPPKDPPSPLLPLAIMLLLAACMLWPRVIGHAAAPAGSILRAKTSCLGDFAPDLRPSGLPVYSLAAR